METNTLPTLGQRIYVDLGDSVIDGGEFIGTVTALDGQTLTVGSHVIPLDRDFYWEPEPTRP